MKKGRRWPSFFLPLSPLFCTTVTDCLTSSALQWLPAARPLCRHGAARQDRPLAGLARALVCAGALLWCGVGAVQAQPVYRCGQAYTNTPPPGQVCERLPEQQITVIEGTRVQRPVLREPVVPAAAAAGSRESATGQAGREALRSGAVMPSEPATVPAPAWRQAQAREVLLEELARTRARHAQVQRELASLAPAADAARQQALQKALARSERDLQSLQRELDRLNPGAPQ